MPNPALFEDVNGESGALALAIVAGAALGDAKEHPNTKGHPYTLVPEGFTLETLEPEAHPPRKTGEVTTHDVASFCDYVLRHKTTNTVIYGAVQPAGFVAVLNDHAGEAPREEDTEGANWRDFRCKYPLVYSDEWAAWTGRNRKDFDGNKAFAEWLEDNLVDIMEPANNRMMEVALGFAVTTGASFSNPVNLDTGEVKFAYTIENKQGTIDIPKAFVIEIPVFRGLEARKYRIEVRFRYKARDGNVTMRFELVRPHKVIEQAFKDELEIVREKTGALVIFGEP